MVSLFLVLKKQNKKRHDNLVKSIYHSEFKMSKLFANYPVTVPARKTIILSFQLMLANSQSNAQSFRSAYLKKKNNLAHFYSCELKNLKVAGTYSQHLKKKILHDFTNPIQGCVKFLFVELSQIKLILLVSTPL